MSALVVPELIGYLGGKAGNGTYQQLITHIPKHNKFCSYFLGHCGVFRNIRPAASGLLNDLDPVVAKAWSAVELPDNYRVCQEDALILIAERNEQREALNKTFLFLDPPYLIELRKSVKSVYNVEFTTMEHNILLELIKDSPAMIMICCYPNGLYADLLKHWNSFDYYSITRAGRRVLERVYYNYEIHDLHDYRYIGVDYREREALSRVKKNVIKKLEKLPELLRQSIIADLSELYLKNS